MQIQTQKYNTTQKEGLGNYIREIYAFSTEANAEQYTEQVIIDDGCYDFVFYEGEDAYFLYDNPQIKIQLENRPFTIHQPSPPYRVSFRGTLQFTTLKVQPWLNAMFFPLAKKNAGVIDLKSYYGDTIQDLHRGIYDYQGFEDRVCLLEEFITRCAPQISDELSLVREICEQIYQDKGVNKVKNLAEQFAMNRQDLNKLFKKHVLYTLKNFMCIVRVHTAIKYKIAEPEISFTALSHLSGYFDQAHFNNDFIRVCGVSPSTFFSNLPDFMHRHKP